MTRLLIPCLTLALVLAAGRLNGQSNPNPGGTSRYLPPRAAAAAPNNSPNNQPAAVPQRIFGPQPANPQNASSQPVRQASGQQPARQASGPVFMETGDPARGAANALGKLLPQVPATPQQPAWFPL